MKPALLIYFILSATLSYSQATPARRIINHDSLIEMQNKRRLACIGKPYPEFSVFANNKEYSNLNLKGKVVLLNFWFSTCAPCIAEFDDLNKLFEKFNQNKNFEFISFTFENQNIIDSIKKKYDIKYTVFSLSGEECDRLNLQSGFPKTIMIDTAGNIKYISLIGQLNNFTGIIYPLISKEL